MQPVLSLAFTRSQRFHHLGPQIARQQRQHVLAPDLRAERARFGREQFVEGVDVDFGALEFRPGVFQMIGGVGAADDVGRQPALALEPREGLERR